MPASRIALLGAFAGFTIYLGLPVGRVPALRPGARALLNACATGILVFLLWDVLAHAWEPVDAALGEHRPGAALGVGAVLGAGLTVGLAGLVYFDRWIARRRPTPAGGGLTPVQLAFLIAAAIGLHNFAEGLAIGSSAAKGELALAVLLMIGFGLHNATEGFGIVAPMTASGTRPTWSQLALLGLIGGGPTFVGTVIGQQVTNEVLSVAFLALAAGSILYVVIELLAVARGMSLKLATTWGILLGLGLGFVTDAVVTAAGA